MTCAGTYHGGGDESDESVIARLANEILMQAAMRSADAVAYPSLPDGEAVEEGGPTDPDASPRNALNDLRIASVDPGLKGEKPIPNVYFRKAGKWRLVMVLPEDILDETLSQLLAMAGLPSRSRKPQEGVIRLKTPEGNVSSFRLRHDPAASRVLIDMTNMVQG